MFFFFQFGLRKTHFWPGCERLFCCSETNVLLEDPGETLTPENIGLIHQKNGVNQKKWVPLQKKCAN